MATSRPRPTIYCKALRPRNVSSSQWGSPISFTPKRPEEKKEGTQRERQRIRYILGDARLSALSLLLHQVRLFHSPSPSQCCNRYKFANLDLLQEVNMPSRPQRPDTSEIYSVYVEDGPSMTRERMVGGKQALRIHVHPTSGP